MQLSVELLKRGNYTSLVDQHEEWPLLGEIVRCARKRARARLRDVGGRLDALSPQRLHVNVRGRGHEAARRSIYHGRSIAEF